MNKFLIVLLSLPLLASAQNNEKSRKGAFQFTLGPEYRITPIYASPAADGFSEVATFTGIDQQNSGVAVNLGVEYFILKDLSLGFTTTLRYDSVNKEFSSNQESFLVSNINYNLLIGYQFNLNYYFRPFKKGEFFITAGTSLLNRNSDFTVQETFFDDNGDEIVTTLSTLDANYGASRFSLGYKNGLGRVYIGTYITSTTPYFEATTTFIVPFVGCSFDIGKL